MICPLKSRDSWFLHVNVEHRCGKPTMNAGIFPKRTPWVFHIFLVCWNTLGIPWNHIKALKPIESIPDYHVPSGKLLHNYGKIHHFQ